MKINKEYFKVLLDAMDKVAEGVTIADATQPDLPLIYINQGFTRMTGYTSEEIIGKNCRFLQASDTAQESIDTIRKSIKNKTECTVELRNYKKDGTLFWNRLSFVPLFDENGELKYFVGIQSDITKEKLLLKEKSELNAMRTTLQSVNDIVFNFMNTLQLVRFHLENEPTPNREILEDFDKAFNDTSDKLQMLNALPAYKEKIIGGRIKVIDTN